jgi:hypothetical protein
MFSPVNRRKLARPLIYVLVAAQLLLSAPIVSAMAGEMASPAKDMACADMTPRTEDSKPCPCCPDGVMSMAACLSACAAAVAALPSVRIYLSAVTAAPAIVPRFASIAELADPPLKPPPIA